MPGHGMMQFPCHYNLTSVFTRYPGFENNRDSETEQPANGTPKRRPEPRPQSLLTNVTPPSVPLPLLCKFWFDCQLQQWTVQSSVPLQYVDLRLYLCPQADIPANTGQDNMPKTYADISWNMRRESPSMVGIILCSPITIQTMTRCWKCKISMSCDSSQIRAWKNKKKII